MVSYVGTRHLVHFYVNLQNCEKSLLAFSCLSVCLSVWLAGWLAGWLAVCLSVCLSICTEWLGSLWIPFKKKKLNLIIFVICQNLSFIKIVQE
jgi:hypothetical protein